MTEGAWPVFSPEEVAAVTRVLESGKVNYWTGTEGREFEREWAEFVGMKHAIVMTNGTLTLEAALRSLGIGPGDEVIVSPRSFIASASTVVQVGATPIFADVECEGGNLSAETISAVITPKTKAVIVVHLGGWPANMTEISALCKPRGIKIIEDCAQAHGGKWNGQPLGQFSDIASWSFCQDKIMTTGGEGGMVATNDEELWRAMWAIKDHGKSYKAVYETEHAPGFRWLHESIGSNWRMTEIQSAIGRVQLRLLPEWVETRRANMHKINVGVRGLSALRVPEPPADAHHAGYKHYVYLRPEALKDGWNQQRIVDAISEQGVKAFSGSCSEIYLEKAFTDLGIGPSAPLPVAKELGETSLMFLIHPTLSSEYIDRTIAAINAVMKEATR
ncbi:MAG: DegT/DnrJ/EryC1/StrS aminotransferase family protein [Armatimonadetes bacterium]|nr:DegT/DnrJ/EryC1/StrS aminotransferase family protein [Armatimonadota bacterium]